MIRIKPFKGVRPAEEHAQKVAAFPYDVVNTEEAREIASGNDYSFLHVSKPEIDLPAGNDLYSDEVYKKGKENYENLKKNNILIKEKEDSLYIYTEKMGDIYQKGLVVCCHIDDYLENRIKKHEHTRTAKEEDRIKHVDTVNANTGPVFLTYKQNREIQYIIDSWINSYSPVYNIKTEDGIEHKFYKINDRDILKKLIEKFNDVEALYVADGHHRSAAAAKTGDRRRQANPDHTGNEEYNWFLSIIFPHNELYIMDYNRAVKDLNGLCSEDFLKEISNNFTIEEQNQKYKPEKKHTFGMFLEDKWYKLTPIKDTFNEADVIDSLDVSILYKNLLKPVLNIGDPKTDDRIDFIGGIRGLEELERIVKNNKFKVSFSMYPTSINDLMNVADADEVMPPKSTWFEPKLRSGLIVHELE
ncbi:MAG: DUF1015 domain-containing protein [Candidatus Muiribacteriota bacterium]